MLPVNIMQITTSVNLIISGKFFDCMIDKLCGVQIFDSVVCTNLNTYKC